MKAYERSLQPSMVGLAERSVHYSVHCISTPWVNLLLYMEHTLGEFAIIHGCMASQLVPYFTPLTQVATAVVKGPLTCKMVIA